MLCPFLVDCVVGAAPVAMVRGKGKAFNGVKVGEGLMKRRVVITMFFSLRSRIFRKRLKRQSLRAKSCTWTGKIGMHLRWGKGDK